jgi:hypothetical protein
MDAASAGKPAAVVRAVTLLWASIGLGLLWLIVDPTSALYDAEAPVGGTVVLLALSIAFLAFLTVKISAGRNWARIVFLVMFVVSMVPTVLLFADGFQQSPGGGVVSLVQMALQIYALLLLFTDPGRRWFIRTA